MVSAIHGAQAARLRSGVVVLLEVIDAFGGDHEQRAVRALHELPVVQIPHRELELFAGAATIIAVDVSAEKETLARANGATEFLVAADDTAKQVRKLTDGRGADVAVECVGRASTIRQAWSTTRRGGRAVVVGIGRNDDKAAFGATEVARLPGPDGKLMHGAVRIEGSVVMLVDENREWGALGPKALKGSPVTIHVYVSDVDAFVAKAVKAGAREIMPIDDMFWGDRYGIIEDPFGHHWEIGRPLPEGRKS